MTKKILNLLTNNLGLKLAAVVLAIILWLIVVNIDNPQTTITYTQTAQFTNEDIITENGKVYEILDNSNVIKFQVTGPRTIVEGLSVSDFTVTADLNKIDLSLGLVPVEVVANRYASKLQITVKTTNVLVSIEDLKIQQFAVNATATGTPQQGYALGEVKCDPATITISGPESTLAKIDKVIASINIDGMYASRSQKIVPTILDEKGEPIVSSTITIEPSSVDVSAEILETKTVNIECEYEGSIKSGYSLVAVECLPETITVKGNSDALASVDKIVIPSSALGISLLEKDTEKTISIDSYIPEGVEIVDKDNSSIVVRLTISGSTSRTLDVPIADLEVKGLKNGYNIEFEQNVIKVTLTGNEDVINKIEASDIRLSIDVSDEGEGNFHLTPDAGKLANVSAVKVSIVSGKITIDGGEDDSNSDDE